MPLTRCIEQHVDIYQNKNESANLKFYLLWARLLDICISAISADSYNGASSLITALIQLKQDREENLVLIVDFGI